MPLKFLADRSMMHHLVAISPKHLLSLDNPHRRVG